MSTWSASQPPPGSSTLERTAAKSHIAMGNAAARELIADPMRRHYQDRSCFYLNRRGAVPSLRLETASGVSLAWRIGAPPARVWQCLTHADFLSQWLGRLVDGAVGAGTDFVVDHGDNHLCRSNVVAFVEPTRLAFTWGFPTEPQSEVVLELSEAAEGTELRLAHSALGELAPSYRDGWCVHLTYLEAAALGTPLPTSVFWQLHGTIAQLQAAGGDI